MKFLPWGTTGGFEGWIQEIEGINPDLIAYGGTPITPHIRKLFDWSEIQYTPTQIGPWLLFVRNISYGSMISNV